MGMTGVDGAWKADEFVLPGGVRILSGDGAPVDGTTGKLVAAPGSLYIDYTNAAWYRNSGTAAIPAWTKESA
jgi:hypothetical protein